jgi:hypothetical protein
LLIPGKEPKHHGARQFEGGAGPVDHRTRAFRLFGPDARELFLGAWRSLLPRRGFVDSGGFEHFAASVNARDNTVMPMFTLYCDDSGTHAESNIAIAGCYIGTVEQRKQVQRNWDEINEKEKFGVFHMADFVARKQQFASPEWQDQAKRNRTLEKLVNVITTRVEFGIAAAVVESAYDAIVPEDMRPRLGKNHYTFAIKMCVAFLEKWREECGYTAPIVRRQLLFPLGRDF